MLAPSSRNALKRASKTLSNSVPRAWTLDFVAQERRHASTATVFRENRQESSSIRSNPYSFTRDSGFRTKLNWGAAVSRYNLHLSRFHAKRDSLGTLQLCRQMKQDGIQPDAYTYGYLLQAVAREGLLLEAWAVFDDMCALGINPDLQMFHNLLNAAQREDDKQVIKILETMEQYSILPNENTYEILIQRDINTDNLEGALQRLHEMGLRDMSPTVKTIGGIIIKAANLGFPRLAFELADAFERTTVRRLDGDVWARCLQACADAHYGEGVQYSWRKVVHDLNITPDEGCCIQVLHTVGRTGLYELGTDVIRVLQNIGVDFKEYHFAPLIEGFCRDKNIADAFAILSLMRDRDIIPTTETAYPIYSLICTDPDLIDKAWEVLEGMHEAGKLVDVTALNVIIQAAVAVGDLQRAVGTYKAYGDLGVTPTVETFNLLLAGCIGANHRELGDRLLTEMKDAWIKPDVRTYERLIVLCLTQSTYEDAFFYLEEMKVEKHTPTQAIYEALIRKCVSVGDTRYKLAVDEMMETGYQMSMKLQTFIDSKGEREVPETQRGDYSQRRRRRESNNRSF